MAKPTLYSESRSSHIAACEPRGGFRTAVTDRIKLTATAAAERGGQVVQHKRVTQKDAAQTFKNIVNALFGGVETSLTHSLPMHACAHACAYANGPLMAPVVCAGRECCRIHL